MTRASVLLSAAILAGTSTVLTPVRCLAQDAVAAPETAVDPGQQQAILGSATSSQDQRDEAARRLVSRGAPRDREIISQSLREPNVPASQLAVVRAIQRASNPDPDWIDPLFTILKNGVGDELVRASAEALASYHNRMDVLTRLIELASRRTDDITGRSATSVMGSFLAKPAAESLIGLLNREDLPPRTKGAVIDALTSMTGLMGNERDIQRWNDWWQQNRTKSDSDFRADLLLTRARRYDEMSRELSTMERSTEALIREQYRSAADDRAREELLISYLQSPAGGIRRVGALLASQDASEGRRVPDAAVNALISQVGDSDDRVRRESVNALQRINDPRSLDALTAQLALEDRSDIRAALIQAMTTVADVRVAPQIIALLDDRSPLVVKAAADALASLGTQLRENGELSTVAAAKLRVIFTGSTGKSGMQEVREASLEALVPLRRPEMLDLFLASLKKDESTRIRRAAVNGIAEVGGEKDADTIAPYLDDSDKAVQLDAVKAMGTLKASEFSSKLVALMTGGTNDASIKDAAWVAIESFVKADKLKVSQLQLYADEVKADTKKRIFLLKEIARKQLAETKWDEWIATQINIGDCDERLGDFEQAAMDYKQALEQLLKQPNPFVGTLEGLIVSRTRTLLRAGKYEDAVQFAGEWITKDQAYQQTFGPAIRKEVERLNDEATATKNNALLDRAMELIKQSRNVNPPLARKDLQDLKDLETDITKRIANRSQVPNSASGATAGTDPGR